MFDIKDKVIVVTGSSGLLGNAIVTSLRSAGARTIGLDLRQNKEDETNLVCNTTSELEVSEVVEKIIAKHGRIDGWVNNAYPRTSDWGKKLEEVTMDSWRANIDMHLNGYFLCSKIVLEKMKASGKGSLINMGSIYGVQAPDFTVYEGTPMTSAVGYSAIKGGIINLTRYLAAYYGGSNIRVNCISPGGIFDNQQESFVKAFEKKVPLKRMGKPGDISPSVVFLMSDESSYITGHNLLIDGGWTIV